MVLPIVVNNKKKPYRKEMLIERTQNQIRDLIKVLYQRINEDISNKNEFIGWYVTQRYKCKTVGGDPAFGDDVFVFNKDLTECIYHVSVEEYESIGNLIEQLISVPEEDFMKNIDEFNDVEQY